MISSASNTQVKQIKRLQSDRRTRQKAGQFVVEGTRWLRDLVQLGQQPERLFVTESWLAASGNQALVDALQPSPTLVSDAVMKSMSDTRTPAGCLAVLPFPDLPWPTAPTFLLILDQIRDPGNLGTMLRTAAAAGVEGVVLTPNSVDPFNPKVVRSTMGALLRVPVRRAAAEAFEAVLGDCALWIAAGEGSQVYFDADWNRPVALLIGGEADGASAAVRALPHTLVTIPMANATESLNAASAAAVLLFDIQRQRRA